MLPQLATETFASQIFWVVLGFFCVYGFMHCFAVPKLRKILEERQLYVDDLVKTAELFEKESLKIEKESKDLLSETRRKILEEETKVVEEMESANREEQKRISNDILYRSKKEVASLDTDTEEVFNEVSRDIDDFLDLALNKVRSHKS